MGGAFSYGRVTPVQRVRGQVARMMGGLFPRILGDPSSVSVYLGSPIWYAKALFRARVHGCVQVYLAHK